MDNIKQKFFKPIRFLKRLPFHTKVIGGVSLFVLAGYVVVFVIPKPVTFAYSGDTCAGQWTFLPGLMKQSGGEGFKVDFQEIVSIGGFQLVSSKTCFTALEPPTPGDKVVTVSPFGWLVATKRYALEVGQQPVAQVADFAGKTVATTRPIEITLSQPDDLFDYKIRVGDKDAPCVHEASKLQCDIEQLGLAQGQSYAASLIRYFDGEELGLVGGGEITTLLPIVLANASVADGQTIYDKPMAFVFEYDKDVDVIEAILEIKKGESYEAVAIKSSTEGKEVFVEPEAELERNNAYRLTLKKVEATDGSALSAEYVVGFTMSGGPKVTGVSVGSVSAPLGGSITVTLDQEVANVDQIKELVSATGLAVNVTKSGNKLVFSYPNADRCADFKLTIKKGLESQYGVAQQDDWSFSGRTICYTLSTIGYSTQGRAINSYSFGSGSKTILYTGAIHGNERSTKTLMDSWVNELEVNAHSIPAGVRIVVVPLVNPDGYAANSRYNSRNVDLNRNFDTSDWKSDIETINNQPFPGGGGSAPESEAEAQVLASYTRQLAPYLTMSYHSQAGYAIANTCGNSPSLAATYASITGYSNMTGVSGAFSYEITGTYDDWMCQRYGYPSVLIELRSSSNADFSRNKPALWAMARS